MSPVTILLYVVIIAAITVANFVFWLDFNSYQKELAKQRVYDSD
jgi:hypothetical protein